MEEEKRTEIENILNAPSLYPESTRKSKEVREQEMIDWYEKFDQINDRYNQYGLDIVGTNPNDYLDSGIFRKQRYKVNSTYYPHNSAFPYNYTLIMRDKRFFEMFVAEVIGDTKKYSPTLGAILNDSFFSTAYGVRNGMETMDHILEKYEGERLVFKADLGTAGKTLFPCKIINGKWFIEGENAFYTSTELLHKLQARNGGWIIQECIKQHPIMARFNESSVNTLRIVTFNTGARILVAPVVMRFGAPNTFADNPASGGGFVAWMDENGIVDKYMVDPINKIRLENNMAGVQIPYYKEAIELAMKLHRQIPGLFTIGWDICITETGPLVIEGNDGWDPFLIQTPPNRAMRTTYEEALKERNAYFGIE